MTQPLPRIAINVCTGCGKCVEVCPHQVLGLQQEKAMLVRPELCTYCLACEDLCPVNAIALPFEIVFLQAAASVTDSANSK